MEMEMELKQELEELVARATTSTGRLLVEKQIADSMDDKGKWCVLRMESRQQLQQAVKNRLFVLLEEMGTPTQLFFGGTQFVFPQGPERLEINRILNRVEK